MATASTKQVPIRKGNYLLYTFSLTNFDNSQVFDLRTFVKSIEFYESMYENCISGTATIIDGSGIPQYLPLVGEELLTIAFQTSKDAALYVKTFRVYKVTDVTKDPTIATGTTFTLHFVSPEFITNETVRVYRGYKNMLASDIVKDIYNSYLNTAKLLNIQQTGLAQQIIMPSMKPLQAINLLTTYAQPVSSSSTFFLFFENGAGFNFVNIESLYASSPKATYTITPDNVDPNVGSASKNNLTDQMYIPAGTRNLKSFDRLDAIARGMIANTVEGFDMLTKSSVVNTYDYSQQFNSSSHIETGGYPFVSAKSQDINSQSYKLINSRSMRANSSYFTQNDSDGVTFSKSYEEYLPYRTSVYLQANAIEYVTVVPGNTDLRCGDMIILNIDNRTDLALLKTEQNHRYHTGKFIIKSLTHNLSQGRFFTKLMLAKDCLKREITAEKTFSAGKGQTGSSTTIMTSTVGTTTGTTNNQTHT